MRAKAALLATVIVLGCGQAQISPPPGGPDAARTDSGHGAVVDSGLFVAGLDAGLVGGVDASASLPDAAFVPPDAATIPPDASSPLPDAGEPQCDDGTAEGAKRCSIDLATVVYHDSLDVSAWPVTKTITGVELAPGTSTQSDVGVRVTLTPYNPALDGDSWPDFIMWPPDGDLRYTLWLFVRMGGQWHGAAVHEFWKNRVWTGAPLLTQYTDWIYANPGSPWDTMGDYVPAEGDTVGFMATAGDLRMHKDVLSVNERSNVVTVRLTSTANYTFP
jgi:hypothetical protein